MNSNPNSIDIFEQSVSKDFSLKALSKFDLSAIYFAVIFWSYWAAQLASKWWLSIPMLYITTLVFLLPCALASYELGTVFKWEWGIYIWATKAFGIKHGFMAWWLSWVPIFLLIPLGVSTITAHIQFLFKVEWVLEIQVLIQLMLVACISLISLRTISVSQKYINYFSIWSFFTAVIICFVGIIYAQPLNNPINISDLHSGYLGMLYSAAALWLLWVETPFNQGSEFKEHKKSVAFMILWWTILLLIAYTLGIIGILNLLPQSSINPITGVAQAAHIISPLMGWLLAILIIFAVSAQDVAYMNTYSRFLLVSGIEKRLYAWFWDVSTAWAPYKAILLQAIGSSAVILIFATQPNLSVVFNLYLAWLTAVWCTSLFYIFFGLFIIRRKFSQKYSDIASVWKIPGGNFGLMSTIIVGIVSNLLAIYYVFALPWVGGISPENWMMILGVIYIFLILIWYIIFKITEIKNRN